MSRIVRLGLLGPVPYQQPFSKDLDGLIDRMWEHWAQELQYVLCDKPDLILLPEACDRYPNFNMEQRLSYYEARGSRILEQFQEVCHKYGCYLAYPAARQMPDGSYRNSVQLIGRDGNLCGVYNKNHLVVTEVSEGRMLCGREAPIFELDFGRVVCAICFDLNFEELRQKYEALRPELILFSSMYHGGLVQREWAFHCRSYFAGAVAGLPCTLIDPLGEEIARTTNYFHHLSVPINLDYRVIHLDFNWKGLRAAKEKYGPEVRISDPGYLGAVLLSSESERFTAADVVREFVLEEFDDYLERSRQCRREHTET